MDIPNDIIIHILNLIESIENLIKCHLVCKSFNELMDYKFYQKLLRKYIDLDKYWSYEEKTSCPSTTLFIYKFLYRRFETRKPHEKSIPYNVFTALHFCEIGNLKMLKKIIVFKDMLDTKSSNLDTKSRERAQASDLDPKYLLYLAPTAIFHGRLAIYQYLMNLGIKTDEITALREAIAGNQLKMFIYLLNTGMKLYPGILIDASTSDIEIVKKILEDGSINVNEPLVTHDLHDLHRDGGTTLITAIEMAVMRNKPDTVRLLLDRGSHTHDALILSVEYNMIECFDIVVEREYNIFKLNNAYDDACYHKDRYMIESLKNRRKVLIM